MRKLFWGITAIALGWGGTASAQEAEADSGSWQLHGFGDYSVKKDYVTPRGLVVTTDGVITHLVNGLSVDSPDGVSIYAGTFLALNPGHAPGGQVMNEFDWWVGAKLPIAEGLSANIEYGHWIFPNTGPNDQRNLQFKLSYADKPKNGFSINPHANVFLAVNAKSSSVVLGKPDGTGYLELGATPKYQGEGFTLTAPTWASVGPKNYWVSKDNAALVATLVDGGERSNLGVFSTGLKASVPFKLGGNAGANIYVFGQYYHLFNDGLVAAKQVLNNGTKRDHFNFGAGVGWGF